MPFFDPIIGYELSTSDTKEAIEIYKQTQPYLQDMREFYKKENINIMKFIQDNPLASNPVSLDHITEKGLITKLLFRKAYLPYALFLTDMNMDVNNPLNYDPIFLNALMSLNPFVVKNAATFLAFSTSNEKLLMDPYNILPTGPQ